MVIFEGLKPAKSGLLADPDFGNMKTLFQTFGRDFENMKTQKKTFDKIFLEISKPWIDAREAREKNWGFFRRFTRENR